MINLSDYVATHCVACGKPVMAPATEDYPLCLDDQVQFENWKSDFYGGRVEYLRDAMEKNNG